MKRAKMLLSAAAGAIALSVSGCTGGTFSGYVEASCSPTVDGVTTCTSTQKPIPTVTATETVTTPGPTTTVTVTATPSPTATTAPAPVAPAACAPAPANPAPLSVLAANTDHREWMHGLEVVKHNGQNRVVFSSNKYPPVNPGGGEWVHDIYQSTFDACNPAASFDPKLLVSAPKAQEPASAAVNSAGRMMVTAEDAQFSDWLDQTYGVWDNALGVVKAYGAKLMPPQGGHSGHVAASGDKFGVSFSDGWVDGGGVDNMGTGDDVFFKVVDTNGTAGTMINTAVGTSSRDWWPIVAGSDTNFLQVWQRYGTAGTGGGKVMGAIISQTGQIVKPAFEIFSNNKYYYYDVQWVPAIQRYLVVGSQNVATSNGVAFILDKNGTVVSGHTGLPNPVREGQAVVSDDGTKAVFPGGSGAVVLNLSPSNVLLDKEVPLNWNWDYMGTDGVFAAPGRVVFATNTQAGVKFLTVSF